ncbi:antitermination protein, partial [Escherichia coli]|nr:antitermination protein [Escherichia coli]EEQ3620555.1 antitermination protein [Escherichia coli]EER8814238.1 antitermination protein [Escherichia coli]EES9597584.1 antitermination protein [Escherichia coli]EET5000829.1 antitermination protein [Escherichia coli]
MTRRTQFKGNSRSRRRERLKAKALANGVLAREEAISSEVLHRPTLSRAQIQAKGTHETPDRIEDAKPIKFMAQDVIWQQEEYRRNLERAAIVYANEFGHKQPETGVCLPNVALYAA